MNPTYDLTPADRRHIFRAFYEMTEAYPQLITGEVGLPELDRQFHQAKERFFPCTETGAEGGERSPFACPVPLRCHPFVTNLLCAVVGTYCDILIEKARRGRQEPYRGNADAPGA